MNPYFDSKEEVLTALESDEAQGLRSEQVKSKQAQFGRNQLVEKRRKPIGSVL